MGNAEREQVSSSRNADTLKSSFICCGGCYGGPGYAGALSLATSDSLNVLLIFHSVALDPKCSFINAVTGFGRKWWDRHPACLRNHRQVPVPPTAQRCSICRSCYRDGTELRHNRIHNRPRVAPDYNVHELIVRRVGKIHQDQARAASLSLERQRSRGLDHQGRSYCHEEIAVAERKRMTSPELPAAGIAQTR